MERVQVSIELDVGSDPIAGTIHGGGSTRAFVGWLGLVRALDRAVQPPAGRPSNTVDRPPES